LLESQIIMEAIIREAAALASGVEINPFGNIHASPEFQRHLANTLTQRALKRALERAGEEPLQ